MMLVSGGLSPRTNSRLDPTTLKGQPARRPCRQPVTPGVPYHTNVPMGKAAATGADQRDLFNIDTARTAHEELEGNRRVPSPSESFGRDSPFHGYFPKIVDDPLTGIGRTSPSREETPGRLSRSLSCTSVPQMQSRPFSRAETPQQLSRSLSCTDTSKKLSRSCSRTAIPQTLASRTESPARLMHPAEMLDLLSQSSSESIALPPSRPPTPVSAYDRRRRSYSRSSVLSSANSRRDSTSGLRRRSSASQMCRTPYSDRSYNNIVDDKVDDRNDSLNDALHVHGMEVISLADTKESHNLLRRKHISSAMSVRQHSRGPRSIPGEHFIANKRNRLDSESKQSDLILNHQRTCVRSEDLWDCINDLSRECCDVLGPRHCHDCEKLYKRVDATSRNLESFPVNLSSKQLATMNVIRRMYPQLSPIDIFKRLDCGDISNLSFKQETVKERAKKSAKSDDGPGRRIVKRHSTISAFNIPDGIGFFANIADLRTQLLQQGSSHADRRNAILELHKLQIHLPPVDEVLLEPKDQVDWENPANYYCPPLLSKDAQKQIAGKCGSKFELPIAPDLDTVLSKSAETARKIRQDLTSYKEARNAGEVDQWTTKQRLNSARSCMTTSTLDTEAVFNAAYDEMRSEAGTLDDDVDDDDIDGESKADDEDSILD